MKRAGVILVVWFAAMLAGCVTPAISPSVPEVVPDELPMAKGLYRTSVQGPGTWTVWLSTSGANISHDNYYGFVVGMGLDGPDGTVFVKTFAENPNGTLEPGIGGWVHHGPGASYSQRQGPGPAPARILLLFSTNVEGSWSLTYGLAKGPIDSSSPATDVVAGSMSGPAIFAVHDPRENASFGVELKDTRTRQVAGAYTAGLLSYSAMLQANEPSIVWAYSFCNHEGAGSYRLVIETESVETREGTYLKNFAGTVTTTRSTPSGASFKLEFEPTFDPRTACAIYLVLVPTPLSKLVLDSSVMH